MKFSFIDLPLRIFKIKLFLSQKNIEINPIFYLIVMLECFANKNENGTMITGGCKEVFFS